MRFYLPPRSTVFWISRINTLRITSIRNVLCDGVLLVLLAGMQTNTRRSCDILHATEIVAKQCPRPGETKPYFPRVMNISVQQDLSPTYYHMTDKSEVAAGYCDLQNVDIRSG